VISVGDRSSKQTFEKDLLNLVMGQRWDRNGVVVIHSVSLLSIRSLQVDVVREKVVCDTHAHTIKVILHDYICYMQLTSRNTDW